MGGAVEEDSVQRSARRGGETITDEQKKQVFPEKCSGGIYDSVGKFCTDKRTRRKKHGLEEYERHKKQFERLFLLEENADSCFSCFFCSFCFI